MMKKADKLFEKEHMQYRSSSGNEETRYSYVVKALTDLIFMGQWCKRCARRTENPQVLVQLKTVPQKKPYSFAYRIRRRRYGTVRVVAIRKLLWSRNKKPSKRLDCSMVSYLVWQLSRLEQKSYTLKVVGSSPSQTTKMIRYFTFSLIRI